MHKDRVKHHRGRNTAASSFEQATLGERRRGRPRKRKHMAREEPADGAAPTFRMPRETKEIPPDEESAESDEWEGVESEREEEALEVSSPSPPIEALSREEDSRERQELEVGTAEQIVEVKEGPATLPGTRSPYLLRFRGLSRDGESREEPRETPARPDSGAPGEEESENEERACVVSSPTPDPHPYNLRPR